MYCCYCFLFARIRGIATKTPDAATWNIRLAGRSGSTEDIKVLHIPHQMGPGGIEPLAATTTNRPLIYSQRGGTSPGSQSGR